MIFVISITKCLPSTSYLIIRPDCQAPTTHHARLPGMDMSKMTRQEIEALLRLLAEWEREELELVIQERREAEREGGLH